MSLEFVGISVLWLFLFGYLIIGSIDFGAGFFNMYSRWTGKHYVVETIIHRYLSPVWEVTNVFLVFFFVGIVGFFPDSAYYFGTALLIPSSISIILIAIRGSYYAFSTYSGNENIVYQTLYGITGVLIPASFTIVLTLSEGGFIDIHGHQILLNYSRLFTSPYSWSVVILAIVSVLFISAGFLTYYADKAGDREAFTLLRKYALAWSVPSIVAGVLTLYFLSRHNPIHFHNMFHVFWLFIVSVLSFLSAVYYIYKSRHLGLAFIFIMIQYFSAFLGYGISHYPYLLYSQLSIYDGFTSHTMAIALIIAFIAGLCLLIPSLYLLMRLFLFDRQYVKGNR